ncbi:MAG: aldolase [Epulopiscium sp. Nuni2H_MBin003]|nr:MAG: aldolase [Epulopiscium sp. Nuni2H_MBin003]
MYPSDYEAKKTIIEVGKRMYDKGFVAANDGNISCKVGPSALWTTPTGVSKGFMTPDILVKMDLDGKILLGKHKPSSEVKMHIRVYQENPDILAVTHAHPPVATSFAIAGINLDRAILPEAVVNLGSVPIAHYATPGSTEVPNSIAPYCKEYNAVLLANHGALTWGKDLIEAYYRLESLEYYATVLMYTGKIIGQANELSCSQIDELVEIRQKLGITAGGIPPCNIEATNLKDVVTSENIQKDMIQQITDKVTKQILDILQGDALCK